MKRKDVKLIVIGWIIALPLLIFAGNFFGWTHEKSRGYEGTYWEYFQENWYNPFK